jgi:glutaredoxin
MGIGRELGKHLFVRASGKVAEALSRADVLGGKVRDRVAEKLDALKKPPLPPLVPSSGSSGAPQPLERPQSGLGDPDRAAQVFGRASCPWSGRVVALLESAGVKYAYFDLDSYGSDSVLRELKLETKQDTVPYVYIRGHFIGGYNALDEIQRLGQLDYLTLSKADRARHPLHGRVEIAARSHDGEHIPGE